MQKQTPSKEKKKQGSSHTPFSFQKRYPLDLHVLYLFPFLPPSDKVRAITPSVTNFYFPSPIYLQIQKAISTEWNGFNSLRSLPGGPECRVKGKKAPYISKFVLTISGPSTQLWPLERTVSPVKFAVKDVFINWCKDVFMNRPQYFVRGCL